MGGGNLYNLPPARSDTMSKLREVRAEREREREGVRARTGGREGRGGER